MKRVLAVVTREKTLARINTQKKVKGKGKTVTVPKTPGPGKAKKSFKKKKFNNKKVDNKKSDNEKDDEWFVFCVFDIFSIVSHEENLFSF